MLLGLFVGNGLHRRLLAVGHQGTGVVHSGADSLHQRDIQVLPRRSLHLWTHFGYPQRIGIAVWMLQGPHRTHWTWQYVITLNTILINYPKKNLF